MRSRCGALVSRLVSYILASFLSFFFLFLLSLCSCLRRTVLLLSIITSSRPHDRLCISLFYAVPFASSPTPHFRGLRDVCPCSRCPGHDPPQSFSSRAVKGNAGDECRAPSHVEYARNEAAYARHQVPPMAGSVNPGPGSPTLWQGPGSFLQLTF